MKYDFLTDDIIKRKLISMGSRIKENDEVIRTINSKKEFEFKFFNKNNDYYYSLGSVSHAVLVTLTEQLINKIFLKEIRKYKLLKIKL